MDLMRRSPWEEIVRMRQDMNRILQALSPLQGDVYTPRTDICETDDEVIVTTEIPGLMAKDDLEVGVTEDSITIKGEVRHAQETRDETFAQQERFQGRFYRTMPLPARVLPDRAKASYHNGLLEVRLPKDEAARKHMVKLPVQ